MIRYRLPRYEEGLAPDYEQLAQQERDRLWNMAKAYMYTPTLPNVLNAIGAAWNSLPFVTTADTMNPNINLGISDFAGGPSRGLSAALRLSAAGKVQAAKSAAVRRANAAARKAAEAAKQKPVRQIDVDDPLHPLHVKDPYDNYVDNPAERAAALDYIRDLKLSNQYDQFLERNPGYRIKTKVEPGVGLDWNYPHDVMVKYGLRKPINTANKYTKAVEQLVAAPQQKLATKTSALRSQEYYREKVEDRAQGVYKRQRREFNVQRVLNDGDLRHVNTGRPSMAKIRLAGLNIGNYSASAQRMYNKLSVKAAKNGYSSDNVANFPQMRDFLRELIEAEGHRF